MNHKETLQWIIDNTQAYENLDGGTPTEQFIEKIRHHALIALTDLYNDDIAIYEHLEMFRIGDEYISIDLLPKETKVWVNVYLHDREYGGSEEGGWWYDTYAGVDATETTLERAKQLCSVKQKQYSNKNRREVGSVLSEGAYCVYVEFKKYQSEQLEKQHYA